MPLPHFTNIISHRENFEPIYKNLYECTIVLPTALQTLHPNHTVLLLENATSVKFPTYPTIPMTEQRFKYSTRRFVGVPATTSTDFSISFNMNQNKDYQVFTWRMMKDWYDLVWNNEDGSLHYKKNIIADIVINAHDREGHIIRRVTYFNSQITVFTGWEDLDWAGTDIAALTATFIADYWEDLYY